MTKARENTTIAIVIVIFLGSIAGGYFSRVILPIDHKLVLDDPSENQIAAAAAPNLASFASELEPNSNAAAIALSPAATDNSNAGTTDQNTALNNGDLQVADNTTDGNSNVSPM